MELALVRVADPRFGAERQERVLLVDGDHEELHGLGAQETAARVGEGACDVVNHRFEQNAVVEAHVQEDLFLVVDHHLEELDGFGGRREGLGAQALEAGFWVEGIEFDGEIGKANR